jgi:hypothetical protein
VGVQRVDELLAYQLSVEFKRAVCETIKEALALGRRTAFMIARLQKSLAPFIDST